MGGQVSVSEEVSKDASRRQHIAKEILSTEEQYVESFVTVAELYRIPLVQGNSKNNYKPAINDEESKQIFINWLDLLSFHDKILLPEIKSRVESWSAIGKIGDIFVKRASKLDMYVHYVNKYDEAEQHLLKLKERPAVKEVLTDGLKDPRSRGLDLKSFLIMPIQRLPRYSMLLSDLLKYTPKSHPDHANLENAVAKIKQAAALVNEKKREYDHQKELELISEKLEGTTSSLVAKGRHLIKQNNLKLVFIGRPHQLSEFQRNNSKKWINKVTDMFSSDEGKKDTFKYEGYLTKEGGNFKTMRKRWFVLTYHQIVYYENETACQQQQQPYGVISLTKGSHLLTETQAESRKDFKKERLFLETSSGRIFLLEHETEQGIQTWKENIEKVMKDGSQIEGKSNLNQGDVLSVDGETLTLDTIYSVFLFNNRLILSTPPDNNNSTSMNKQKTKVDQSILKEGYSVHTENTFLEVINQDVAYKFACSSVAEVEEWNKAFLSCLSSLPNQEEKPTQTWDVLGIFSKK
eukprot:Lithocolla_globosa_v1_NODE_1259_length_2726_cov_7.700112.p1 type:complete len:520 gc:universal NODE_1259_length_2726_cov_7.700112:1040-2599(+)